MGDMRADAARNRDCLGRTAYLGQMFVIGRNDRGFATIFFMTQGRRQSSRNRVLTQDGGSLRTEIADPAAVADDTDRILYDAVLAGRGGYHVVSNGIQTNDVYDGVKNDRSLEQVLERWSYQPDKPHFTPRITGLISLDADPKFEISVLRRSPVSKERLPMRFRYPDIEPGYGYGVHTYSGKKTASGVLYPWDGQPMLLPMAGSAQEILEQYREAINPNHLVSMAVKVITDRHDPPSIAIYNVRQKVTQAA